MIGADGALRERVGDVLSTRNVALGPAAGARLPTVSEAVPALSESPKVPSPVIDEIVTIRVLPEPETATAPLAVPVLLSVMLALESVLALKLASL